VDSVAGLIYYYTDVRDLVALEAMTGKVRWRTKVVDAGRGALGTDIAFAAGVVAVGDVDVFAFRASTGERLWRRTGPGTNEGERPIASDGEAFFTSTVDGRYFRVDPQSGQSIWTASLRHGDSAVVAFGSAVHGDVAYVCANRYFFGAQKGSLSAFDKRTGVRLWRHDYEPETPQRPITWCFSSVASANGFVIAAIQDGRIIAHDPATGAIRWTSPGELGSPDLRFVASRGSVLIAISTGTERVTRLDPQNGHVLWRNRTPGGPIGPATPVAIGDDAVVVTHGPPAVAYDLATGAVLWARPDSTENLLSGAAPYRVRAAPLVFNGVAYMVGEDGLRAKKIRD
jgi:outer membrane protein assembly factor BamB